MIFEILVLLLTSILFYFLYSYKRLHSYFKKRDVKFLPGVPFFGNIMATTFLRKHFSQELEKVYKAFPDENCHTPATNQAPIAALIAVGHGIHRMAECYRVTLPASHNTYVGFQEMTTPIILIRDPQLIKNITIKDFDHFVDHKEFFSAELDPLFGGSMFAMNGDKWREMRTTLSPAFTSSKMKCMFQCINEISLNIIQYLIDHEGEDIDVDDVIRRYTNDVIASAGFGFQVNSLKDRDNEFYKAGNGIFDFDFKQRMVLLLAAQFPQLVKKLGVRLFKHSVYDFFFNIVASAMEYRKKENIERPDMIQLMMQAKREWKLEELTGQVFIFFTAGFETSAATLVMTIHELALNQTIQDRLYEECRKLNEEKELTFDSISELKYLDAILNETLRLWSPAVLLDRKCTKTYELPPSREGGKPYVLKPGDIVYNLVNSVQMDPKYWPEPHKYNPDRFLEENKNEITPFTFMPFGVGPRGCLGMRFAILEFKVLLFHLILNFDIVKTDKTSDPIKLQTRTFNIGADGGTSVQFKRRYPQ